MATNNKLLNCPPLRFPEFNDEWKRTTLGEICQIIGGGTPSTEIDKYWGGNIPWFTPSEIRKKHIGYSERTITEEGLNNSGARLLPKGTILLTTRATIGECSISTIPCCTNQGFQSLVVNLNKSTTEFIYQKVHTLRNELLIRANGSTFKEITAQEIRGIHIFIPTLMEQQKIASFLSLLDERIEAQRQIIKERKKQKKALLHQLFSQSLRFPEFEDEWQQTTLGRICKVSTGEMNTQDKVEGGKYPFYVRSSKIERANRYTYDGVSILTPGDGAIGQIFHYSEGKIAVHQRVYMLTEMQCIPKYLFHYFSAKFFERASRMSAKNTVDSVRMNMITDMPLSLPSMEEQKKIAELFTTFDERIEVEEALLACYETQKRYLLQQMFV